MKNVFIYETVLGKIGIAEKENMISDIFFGSEIPFSEEHIMKETELIKKTYSELKLYLDGKLKYFSIPLNPEGTDFRKKVWKELQNIPYGETRSYGEIASATGNSKAGRAVGGANHNNPIAIIIPCHRVIGSDGSLTGYGGGPEIKEFLLNLEQKNKDSL
ncbi:MAG: methylated-DNA--[protein]-cysteine S-methyltransferase [Thermotogae bacterium]|nr:methylated-DNA--[protein]-cysteine S-methyltransferase [Thermotogota bacterium]